MALRGSHFGHKKSKGHAVKKKKALGWAAEMRKLHPKLHGTRMAPGSTHDPFGHKGLH